MKRLLAVLMVYCIILTMLTGCVGVKKKDGDPVKDNKSASKDDIDKALDTLEDAGVTLDPDLEDMLEDIDQADIDAAAAANAAVKVTADLPEGWELDEGSPLSFSAKNGLNMVMVTTASMPGTNNAEEAAEAAIEQIKEYFKDAEYSAVENTKMAGYDGAGYYVDISITKSMVQRQEYFYFMKGKQLFMIQGAYMADDEAAAAEVQKVMDSIKVE